tara:strand:+ start:600 stop:797 length:198 start_codon:yes stop_codon:yes gene_type:complete
MNVNPEVDQLVVSLKRCETVLDKRIDVDANEEIYPLGTIDSLEDIKDKLIQLRDWLSDYHTHDPG